MPLATYDTANKLVILDQVAPDGNGQVQLSVIGLYSDAKQQWLSDLTLNKFSFPWIAIGGQPLPGGAVAPRIFFLRDPWQIRPYEADHDLTLRTNLFTENGIAVTVPTLGAFTVNSNVISEFSSGDDRIAEILSILQSSSGLGLTALGIADAVLSRSISHVEDLAELNSLTELIAAALNSYRSGTTMTINKTDNTLFNQRDIVTDPNGPAVTGISD